VSLPNSSWAIPIAAGRRRSPVGRRTPAPARRRAHQDDG